MTGAEQFIVGVLIGWPIAAVDWWDERHRPRMESDYEPLSLADMRAFSAAFQSAIANRDTTPEDEQ